MIKLRDEKAILSRITQQMQIAGVDVLILTSGESVFYSTGFASRSLYKSGRNGSTISVVTSGGEVTLILSEFDRQAAEAVCDEIVNIQSYPVWIYIEDYAVEGMTKEVQPDMFKTFRKAVECIPPKADGVKIGIEPPYLSYENGKFLRELFGETNLVDCSKIMIEAKAVKTPWEIEVLRHNAHISEVAMYMTARDIVPGMTTVDVYHIFTKHCREMAPDTTDVLHAHTIGADFTPAFIPLKTRIERGDLIRLDGGPVINGYNSDLGRTFAVGGVTVKEREALFNKLWKGYEFAINHIGPGVKMCDIFHGVQEAIGLKGYIRGHHGHSLGCNKSSEEYPFIAPGETRVFESGMVFCLETPYYSSRNHTYNIEDTFLVTDNGIELFSKALPTLYY